MNQTHRRIQRNLLLLIGVVLSGSVLSGCVSSTPQQSVEQACTALVLDYAYYRDRENLQIAAQGVANLFTEEATLTVNGQSFSGRQVIFDRIAQQTNPPLTAHMMSTIRIFPESPGKASGVSYATVYIAPKPAASSDSQDSAVAEGFAAVGEYHDEFILTPQGWRIANRKYITRIRYQRDPN